MITDSRLLFTASQALAATAALTDYIDLGVDRDIGPGQPLYWVVHVLAAPDATTGDETYTFNLQTDDNAAFSSPNTVATLTVPRTAAAGAIFVGVVPPVVGSNERYLRVNAVLAGTTPSVTVQSYLTSEAPTAWQAHNAPFQA